jgi:nucleotide-binding universal stress UspA family protein
VGVFEYLTYKRILVPFDNSPYSEKALDLATALASQFNAQLILLNVVEEFPTTLRMERTKVRSSVTREMVSIREYVKELYQQMKREVLSTLEGKKKRAEEEHISVRTSVAVGYPPDKIIEYIKNEKIDLVIMGTKGRTGISRLAGIGRVARKVTENVTCPVILVH